MTLYLHCYNQNFSNFMYHNLIQKLFIRIFKTSCTTTNLTFCPACKNWPPAAVGMKNSLKINELLIRQDWQSLELNELPIIRCSSFIFDATLFMQAKAANEFQCHF